MFKINSKIQLLMKSESGTYLVTERTISENDMDAEDFFPGGSWWFRFFFFSLSNYKEKVHSNIELVLIKIEK